MALISCKECKKEISTEAKSCPHCGAKMRKPHYLLKAIMIIFFLSWLSSYVQSNKSPIQQVSTAESNAYMAKLKAEGRAIEKDGAIVITSGQNKQSVDSKLANWSYTSEADDMTGKKIYFASVVSTNQISLDFPYNGKQSARLDLRTHPRYGRDIVLGIEKGQFLCRIDSCSVLVRFDDSQPVRFAANEPADHSTTTLFLGNYSGFISRLSKSKKVRIEANLYNNGNQVFEFDVADFNSAEYLKK